MSFISRLGDWLRKISRSFTSASISGQNITLTRHNGDTVVLTTYAPSYSTATQSTDGLMSAQDKNVLDAIPDTYVVKVGTLAYNGLVRTSPGGHSCYALLGSETGPNAEIADFGWDYINRDGSGLGFRSASQEGYFLLYARDATHGSQLVGYPDGRLYWNSIKIPTLADLATTTSNGLVSTDDQTWAGSKTIANSSDTGWCITYGSESSLQTMRFMIGNGHVNRGLWDNRLNKWAFHCDNSKCYVGGYSIEKSVPSNAEFTDTVTTVSTSGSGNAVTDITANNGQLSVTKGASFFPLPTLKSGTLTPTSNIGSNYSDVKKYGNVGIFILSAGTPITFSGWTKYHLFTSSIKPKSYTSGYIHNQNGTQGGAFLEMETDGKIYLHTTGGTMPTNDYWHGSLVFFTD